jgi:demethylmenaquinone methyltransferase / 2-methoxy-6-polyprenyl-1,4-benzoquinol methylase
MQVKPYRNAQGSKKEQVEKMFDSISGKYDFLNHSLSINLDKYWRRKAINRLKGTPVKELLDVATGTGDMIYPAVRLKPLKISAIDISEGMLSIARRKFTSNYKGTEIEFLKADSEALPFRDNSFDAETVAFGVRNFEDTLKGLAEMYRVLRPGGMIVVLEFSKPASFPFRNIYQFYFRNVLPFFGRLISGDKEAYTYLPDSVNAFPEKKEFVALMEAAGFVNCSFDSLTFGVATLYTGIK